MLDDILLDVLVLDRVMGARVVPIQAWEWVFITVIFGGFVVFVVWIATTLLRVMLFGPYVSIKEAHRDTTFVFTSRKSLSLAEVEILKEYPYYQKLNPHWQQLFQDRLINFMSIKQFVPNGIDITLRMKILISAAAIQLTLGLKRYRLVAFETIEVCPSSYISVHTQKENKGHVTLAGRIVLAWNHFEHGFRNETDGINLGLHEMAHALKFQFMMRGYYKDYFNDFELWKKFGIQKLQQLRDHKIKVLRSYGGRNLDELLAVSTENFFETPEVFRERLPNLYLAMCVLYRQDPLHESIVLDPEQYEDYRKKLKTYIDVVV